MLDKFGRMCYNINRDFVKINDKKGLFMKGYFNDSKNGIANIAGGAVFIVGFIATVIISLKLNDYSNGYGGIFSFFGVLITILIMFAIINMLSKGNFSADEKSVAFSVGFSKYEYSYKNIISARTEITFTNGRYGAKIPHTELVLSLRNGRIVRFSDAVPSYESDTLESIRKFQNSHQFTKLACYIKSKL